MKRRKFISIFVCLCLLLTMIPAAAFAAESESVSDAPQTVPSQETTAQPQQEPADSVPPEKTAPAAVETTEPSVLAETEPAVEPEPQQTDALKAQPQEKTPAEAAPTAEKAQKSAAPAEKASAEPAAKKAAASTNTVATVKKTDTGIKVTGGVEGKDWEYDPANQSLTIKKDGMTVSGTATDNLAILCSLAVTTITLDGLNHGNNEILLEAENDQFDLILKGRNKIDMLLGAGDVTIKGTKNSNLDVSTMVIAYRDLSLKDATVSSPFLIGMRDINISGKSVVTAKSTERSKALEEMMGEDPFARITALRDINIGLTSGGSITSIGTKEILPMMAGNKINLEKGSKVVTPNGGKVGTLKIDGFPTQVILDANGNPAADVVIKNGNTLTASATVTDASSISPQTGDNSMDSVMWAFVLAAFAAAVLAALVLERRRHNQ